MAKWLGILSCAPEAGESQTLCRQTSRQRLVLLACGLVFADVSLIFSILILLWDFFKAWFLFVSVVRERGLEEKTERSMKEWDERDWRNEMRRSRSCVPLFLFPLSTPFIYKKSKSIADS